MSGLLGPLSLVILSVRVIARGSRGDARCFDCIQKQDITMHLSKLRRRDFEIELRFIKNINLQNSCVLGNRSYCLFRFVLFL